MRDTVERSQLRSAAEPLRSARLSQLMFVLAAWTGFMRAAQTLKSEGSFGGLANLVPYVEIDALFSRELRGHQAQGRW